MNVPTISMPPDEARIKQQAYETQLSRRNDPEYEQASIGYSLLAQGVTLINLTEAFAMAGLHEDGRPKLAIARADRKQVKVNHRNGFFWFNTRKGYSGGYTGDLDIPIQLQLPENKKYIDTGYSLVPMVPADVRPKGQLKDYFILWEVEKWADRSLLTVPDRDPFLLKKIGGDLYAVVAEWELTELERAIMSARRQN